MFLSGRLIGILLLASLCAACGGRQSAEVTHVVVVHDDDFAEAHSVPERGEVPEPDRWDTLPGGLDIQIGRIGVRGPVSAAEVRESIHERGRWIRHCYAAALHRHPDTRGEVVLVGVIRPDGSTEGVRVEHNRTVDPELGQCVRRTLESLHYSQVPRRLPVHFRIPIRFMHP